MSFLLNFMIFRTVFIKFYENFTLFLPADQVCRLIFLEFFAFECLCPIGMKGLPFTYEPTSAEVELLDYI